MKKNYEPKVIEKKIYENWESSGYFTATPDENKEPFCIMIPPPNVTGTLHMGHGFQNTLMDALIRHKRMSGFDVLWQVGVDHAGIATQMVVERQLESEGKSKESIGRDAFEKRVWEWKEKSGGTITQQLRRLGGVGLNDGAMDEAKIDLLLAETARKRDKYATIISIADSGAVADDKAKRIIDAAIAYDKLNDKYGLYNAQGKIDGSQGSSATGTSIDLKEMYKNKPRYRTVLPNSETYKNTPSLLKRFPNGYHLDLKGFNKITITPKTGA